MIGWAITFLVVASVAALLGFGGLAGTAMEAAKIVFFVAVALFLVFGGLRRVARALAAALKNAAEHPTADRPAGDRPAGHAASSREQAEVDVEMPTS